MVLSDPVELGVPELGDFAVSLFLSGRATWHFEGYRRPDERPHPLRPLRRTPSTMRRLATRKTTSRGKALSAAPAMMGP
jgi:hypothetical protein